MILHRSLSTLLLLKGHEITEECSVKIPMKFQAGMRHDGVETTPIGICDQYPDTQHNCIGICDTVSQYNGITPE